MPTIFTECDQCSYLDFFKIDHPHNKHYKEDLEKQDILIQMGLPKEIGQIIIKMSNNIDILECDFCIGHKMKLCRHHQVSARRFGEKYRGYGMMCDSCCWFEIT